MEFSPQKISIAEPLIDLSNKKFGIAIKKHTIVDEKNPFVLYALEIKSEFSRYIVLKQFQNFIKLQQEVPHNSYCLARQT